MLKGGLSATTDCVLGPEDMVYVISFDFAYFCVVLYGRYLIVSKGVSLHLAAALLIYRCVVVAPLIHYLVNILYCSYIPSQRLLHDVHSCCTYYSILVTISNASLL